MLWIETNILMTKIQEMFKPLLAETGLDMAQLHVLRSLYCNDGVTASELAGSVGRAATAFTPVLDKLVKKGVVARAKHPTDRRAILVVLTPAGENLRETVTSCAEEIDAQLAASVYDWFVVPALPVNR